LQPFLSQLGLLLFPIALKMNELRSTSTGLASSTLPLTLIQVRCDQLVRAPHSHATTVHGDCKITVQFSHGVFPLNRVIEKTRKVRSRITRVACIEIYYIYCIVLYRQHVSTLSEGHNQAVEVMYKSHMVYAYLPGCRSVSFTFKHTLRQ
jgi:hypothetical protein